MVDFAVTRLPYLARVSWQEVGDAHPRAPQLAVYAPGLACADPDAHQDVAARLHYGFLAQPYEQWGFLGPTCYVAWRPGVSLAAWETALEQRHFLAGTGLALPWRSTTQRRYWTLVPALALLWQVEPHKAFLRGWLKRLTTNKQLLTKQQKATLLTMLRERGAARVAGQAWPAELAAHTRILRRRRDLAFRLGRLAALDLAAEDAWRVQQLQAQNTAWERGRMVALPEHTTRRIAALEARYVDARRAAAGQLAKEIVEQKTKV